MVPILLSSFAFCFSAIELNIEGSMSYVKSNAALSNQNCSPRSSISCFLSWVLPQSLPHCMALIWKLSPPSSHLLFIPLVWCLLTLEFLQDPYLGTLHPNFFFFNFSISTISFMISLIGSVISLVKSCTTSGWSFLQQESCEVMHNIWTEFPPAGIHCFMMAVADFTTKMTPSPMM